MPDLVEHLRRKFADEPRLEVIHADALDIDLSRWGDAPIAGNLPYYAATPIIEQNSPAARSARGFPDSKGSGGAAGRRRRAIANTDSSA